MKDSYSFDVDAGRPRRVVPATLRGVPARSSLRCGLETLAVEASSGSMGGSESIEFMVESDAGEDFVATCARCGYAANVEKATSQLARGRGRAAGSPRPSTSPTPGVRTIEDLAALRGRRARRAPDQDARLLGRRRARARAAARRPRALRAEARRRRSRRARSGPRATAEIRARARRAARAASARSASRAAP